MEKKIQEIQEQYNTNVANYVKYIFDYQFPSFAEYFSKIQSAVKSNDFATISKQKSILAPSLMIW